MSSDEALAPLERQVELALLRELRIEEQITEKQFEILARDLRDG